MKVGVLGLGYVGLTTALGFAEKGVAVVGFDQDARRTTEIAAGRCPVHEAGLADALARHLGSRFTLASGAEDVVRASDVVFLAVGTPVDARGASDLAALLAATRAFAKAAGGGPRKHLVVKSTVPPGTTRDVVAPVLAAAGLVLGRDVFLSVNPEFLREGHAWLDFLSPDRVVVGVDGAAPGEELAALYAPFGAPIVRLDPTTAEFVKHASNALLATLVSFSNELAMAAPRLGVVDVPSAFRALHMDRRWSGSPAPMTGYLWPGSGFGGYCLPKDTAAMAHVMESKGADASLLRDVLAVNERAKADVVERVAAVAPPSKRVGVLGLAFKPGTADVRGSPAVDVVRLLVARGHRDVLAFDPAAMSEARAVCPPGIRYASTLEEACRDADVLVILTAWPEFLRVPVLAPGKPVVDGRHILGGI